MKRNVALLYLKSNRYDEALDELKEVEVGELKVSHTFVYRNLKGLSTVRQASNWPRPTKL